MENKIKHLEMIQGVINRMSNNCFKLKGWAVTLVSAIVALAAKDTEKLYYLVVYVPVIVFLLLDSYYLLQEKLYRELYNEVRLKNDDSTDFSMDASKFKNKTSNYTYIKYIYTKTTSGFYLPLAAICTLVVFLPFIIK